ncbi:hypothetical protein NFI96_011767, partial [Prochilodus magdalenae]
MSGSGLVPFLAVLLLQLWGAHTLPPTTACLVPCLCQKTPLLNCSSAGLIKVPSQIPATATSLDLSHNALQSLGPLDSSRIRLRGLQHFWVGNNALETLSLCFGKEVNSIKTLRRNKRCVTWAPDLQMLSGERNQLKQIPGGLGSVKSLQILQLSHNRISELGPADLAGCTHLKEVYLQHNLINTVHPQAFKDLPNLQVLDLSHNLLTIIPLPAYLSLRNLNTLVAISGNRWRCDCNLKTIRRWLSFDKELGNPGWNVVCVSPSHHAGKDLLHLEESDLTCPPPVNSMPGFTKEVTVDEGTELLLSCATVTQEFLSTTVQITNRTKPNQTSYKLVGGHLKAKSLRINMFFSSATSQNSTQDFMSAFQDSRRSTCQYLIYMFIKEFMKQGCDEKPKMFW